MKYNVKYLMLCVVFLVAFISCTENSSKKNETEEKPDIVYLKDLIDLEKVDSVIMHNNISTHVIKGSKLTKFVNKISQLELDEGEYKMGFIGFTLFINKTKIDFSGSTHGEFIEMSANDVVKHKGWLSTNYIYFQSKSINLDNF